MFLVRVYYTEESRAQTGVGFRTLRLRWETQSVAELHADNIFRDDSYNDVPRIDCVVVMDETGEVLYEKEA